MNARISAVPFLAAMLLLAACSSGGTPPNSQDTDPATSSGPATTTSAAPVANSNDPNDASTPPTAACVGQLSDDAVLNLLPASLDIGDTAVELERTPDSGEPMSTEEVESLSHFLPGIDPAVLACVRFVSGMGYDDQGFQLISVTAYAAPDGSPVSGADLAAAATRRYTESSQFECTDAGSAPADLLCDGGLDAFSSAGYVAFDVMVGNLNTGIDLKAVAAALAAR